MNERRSRYESATFWCLVAGSVLALGGLLVTVGVAVKSPSQTVWAEPWFDAGACVLLLGVMVLVAGIRVYLIDARATPNVASTIKVGAGIGRAIRLSDGMATPWREILDADSKHKLRVELGNGQDLRRMVRSAVTDEQLFEVQKRVSDWRWRVLSTLADTGHSTLHDRFAKDEAPPRAVPSSASPREELLNIMEHRIKTLDAMLSTQPFQ